MEEMETSGYNRGLGICYFELNHFLTLAKSITVAMHHFLSVIQVQSQLPPKSVVMLQA